MAIGGTVPILVVAIAVAIPIAIVCRGLQDACHKKKGEQCRYQQGNFAVGLRENIFHKRNLVAGGLPRNGAFTP